MQTTLTTQATNLAQTNQVLTNIQQYEPYVQYWDNFNLSLLLFLVLMTIYYVSSLYKKPDWKYEEYSRSMKAKVIKYGFRFLLVSFVLNLFASIWI